MTNTDDTHESRAADSNERLLFTVQPRGHGGQSIHGHNHHASTLDYAREYARDVLTRPGYFGYWIESVAITGHMHEFRRGAWSPLSDVEAQRHHEIVTRETMAQWPVTLDPLYDLRRHAVKTDLRLAALLRHFAIPDVTEEDVDAELDQR